ncbi:phosphatidylinositol-4-phosphate 5-kinase family protein [Actinidia rufa]|uniref:1-phosphatidylinositol-4-phosphate 5-kinase n=1 Tax=Actinidia rufa TaxID=165716 RepID=A0A7J0ES86_9ERIC|nr:phosphatidylinositol-4-phosphate 5-kinase family protein [Actinidia rufa]
MKRGSISLLKVKQGYYRHQGHQGLMGLSYRGAWRMNVQHGLGRKEYRYSDVYDGLWKEGVHEGHGRYAWSNGNTYIGNWKDGKTWGRGVMKWVNGDLFDGFWLNGFRHGSGCCRFADGSYYFGTWTKDLKDGQGTYYPAGKVQAENLTDPHCWMKVGALVIPPVTSHLVTLPCTLTHSSDGGQYEVEDNASVVFEREYMQGVLIKERIRKGTGLSYKSKHLRKFCAKEMKKGSCVDIFEGHRSYYLMLNLQLGIRYTVGKITPVPMREVRASDFGERARIRMYFPRKGSQVTPPHYSVDFYWKDYCPMVFRNLREMFKLDAAEYMMSICGDDGLRELSSPGKSGSIFYISHDDRFFIKTLRRSELKILLKMLPRYYDHVKEHENTLITKFFGLHRITLTGGRKVRFVVMGNMFCTELCIHRRFDLKGSTHGRITNQDLIDESTTLKDLDLQYEFHMDKLVRESLFKQLNLDCTFLESQQIIDYSLLMGLHFRAPEQLKALLEPPDALHKHENLHQTDGAISQEFQIPPKGLLLVTHEPSSVITTPVPHSRGNTLRAFSVGEKEVDLLLPGTARLRVQLGVNMPAQARRKLLPQEETDSVEAELYEVYDVVLYLGTIDILQNYSMKKKIEHAYKSLQHGPTSISSVEPKLYSNRFIDFLEKVFPYAQQP